MVCESLDQSVLGNVSLELATWGRPTHFGLMFLEGWIVKLLVGIEWSQISSIHLGFAPNSLFNYYF